MNRKVVYSAAGVIVFGIAFALFRPDLLFVNKSVNEAFPAAVAQGQSVPGTMPVSLATGKFRSLAHATTGTATVFDVPGTGHVLRFTGFETSNGPDVHVYLVAAADARDNASVTSAGFLDLGSIKGNKGDQNYTLPAEADLGKYQAVTIWCKRFSVNFATAPLKAGGQG